MNTVYDSTMKKFHQFEKTAITEGHKRDAELYAWDMKQYRAVNDIVCYLGYDVLVNEILERPVGSTMSQCQDPTQIIQALRMICMPVIGELKNG